MGVVNNSTAPSSAPSSSSSSSLGGDGSSNAAPSNLNATTTGDEGPEIGRACGPGGSFDDVKGGRVVDEMWQATSSPSFSPSLFSSSSSSPPSSSQPLHPSDGGLGGGGGPLYCSLDRTTWLSPDQMVGRLRNRHLIFSGDSMQRQVFLRVVTYLRGLPSMVEHFFHRDAIYVRNATSDLYWTSHHEQFHRGAVKYLHHPHHHAASAAPAEAAHSGNHGAAFSGPRRVVVIVDPDHPSKIGSLENPDFIVQFFWDVDRERTCYERVKEAFTGSGMPYPIYAPAVHYWRKENMTTTHDLQALVDLSRMHEVTQGRHHRHHHHLHQPKICWITTPRYFLNPSDEQYGWQEDVWIEERNAFFRANVGAFNGSIVPLDLMANTGAFKRTDGLHYGCKYDMDSWRDPPADSFRVPPHFSEPNGADCRSMINLNVAQMVLALSP